MSPQPRARSSFVRLARRLTAIGRRFDDRNWVLGTSGNFSAVVMRDPLTIAITASASHKGRLTVRDILQVREQGAMDNGDGRRPSAETRLHLEIVKKRQAGAVLHTHSVWGTIVSDLHADARGLAIEGYEMLKGLDGVVTHDHREWVPIIENDQDMERLTAVLARVLREHPHAHAVLLRRHGLYTWGQTLDAAERHVEILEFLLEAIGRRSTPWRE